VLLESLSTLQRANEFDRANFEDTEMALNPFGIMLEFTLVVLLFPFREEQRCSLANGCCQYISLRSGKGEIETNSLRRSSAARFAPSFGSPTVR